MRGGAAVGHDGEPDAEGTARACICSSDRPSVGADALGGSICFDRSCDGLLEIGIVARERERGAVVRQRRGQIAAAVSDLGQAADRGQVLGRAGEHVLQLRLRVVELAELDERAAERHARGQIAGMKREAGAAGVDRFLVLPGAADSSASCAKAIDAGSFWTRRRRSSIR